MQARSIRQAAKDLNIPLSTAISRRRRAIREQIGDILGYDPRNEVEAILDVTELHSLKMQMRELMKLENGERSRTDEITEEMIERARNYPVDRLIEFVKGKALCFNHQEKTPSLNHDKSRNRAKCFGQCCQSWDSIGVLQTRDGLSFRDAVRNLQ